jgi:hypothetical protein
MEPSVIISIVSLSSSVIGLIVFIVKRFRSCKCCCMECECGRVERVPETPEEGEGNITFNSSPI